MGWLLLAASLLLGACGGVRVVERWEDAGFEGPVERLLLLVPAVELVPAQQDYARDQVAAALRESGFEVSTRSDYFAGAEALTSEALAAALAGSGVDAVLLVIPGEVQMASRGDPDFVDDRLGYVNFDDEISQLFATGGSAASVVRGDDTEKDLSIHLFPASGGTLVWERRLRFNNPGSWLDVLEAAAPRIATELSRAEFVGR